jgi:hypothetical protein
VEDTSGNMMARTEKNWNDINKKEETRKEIVREEMLLLKALYET